MIHPKTLTPWLLTAMLLSGLPADAGNRKPTKPAPAKPQIPFSFITPSQPSPTLTRLQATLQGRVVAERQAPPAQPIYTQIYLTAPPPPEQPAISAINPEPLAPPVTQPVATPAVARAPKAKRAHPFKPDYAEHSWVSDLTTAQAIPLAANIAGFLANQFDPETTILLLAQPSKKQLNNPLTPELETQLRQAGFTLAATRAEAPQAQLVQYQINAVSNGILVQLQTKKYWASRYYPFNAAQALMATHPFTLRTLGETTP